MGQIVLITGGSSGIGRSIGCHLQENGYTVYGTSRTVRENHEFPLLQLDVTDSDSINQAVDLLLEREGRIDVLINNAGIGITGATEEIPVDQVHHVFETNYYGPLRVCAAVLPVMRRQGNGFILNITSIAGAMGLPFRGAYSSSKAALEMASEALRMEVREFGIRVASLAPGDYATNIASGRYHHPLLETSPYHETYGMSLELINAHVDSGNDPREVAVKVRQILGKKNPKVHYTVGSFTQRLSIRLKRILPDKLFEKLLLNHYKL